VKKLQDVKEIIKEIEKKRIESTTGKKYETRSQKDEIAVMKGILNDPSYEVSVYDKNGCIGVYNPSKEIRKMIGGIITNTTGVQPNESKRIMDNYEFSTNDAKAMISFSKEFINSYMHTGRKMSLGGREKSDVSFIKRIIPEGTIKSPEIIGTNENGDPIYSNTKETKLEEYETIKVFSPYPQWLKKE
jgi:hypothetical protein